MLSLKKFRVGSCGQDCSDCERTEFDNEYFCDFPHLEELALRRSYGESKSLKLGARPSTPYEDSEVESSPGLVT